MLKYFLILIVACLAVFHVCVAQHGENEDFLTDMPANFVQAFVHLHKRIELAKKYQDYQNRKLQDGEKFNDLLTFFHNVDLASIAKNSLPTLPLNELKYIDMDSKCLAKVLEFVASFQSNDAWGLRGEIILF